MSRKSKVTLIITSVLAVIILAMVAAFWVLAGIYGGVGGAPRG